LALDPSALEEVIEADLRTGHRPCAVVATVGTTSSTALDPIRPMGDIARRFGLWFHVDAALAGSAALLPEMRHIFDGLELADSYVFNPHKWLFTNFDCSLFYVAKASELTRTFEILPEYLKTEQDKVVTNYRDWGIALGRRFRALKLWFVLRSMGLAEIRRKLREHLDWTGKLAGWVDAAEDFELMAPAPLQTVCLRYHPPGADNEAVLDELNSALTKKLNASGRIYLTQTKLNNKVTIRVSLGQTQQTLADVEKAWGIIQEMGRGMEL